MGGAADAVVAGGADSGPEVAEIVGVGAVKHDLEAAFASNLVKAPVELGEEATTNQRNLLGGTRRK